MGTAEVLAEIQKSKKKSSGKKLTYTGGGTAALLQSIRGGKSETFDSGWTATLATSTTMTPPLVKEVEKVYKQAVQPKPQPKPKPGWTSAVAAPTTKAFPLINKELEKVLQPKPQLKPQLTYEDVIASITHPYPVVPLSRDKQSRIEALKYMRPEQVAAMQDLPPEISSLETLALGLTGMMPAAGAAIARIGGKLAARGGAVGKVGKAIAGIGKAGKAADAMPGLAGFGARTAMRAGTGAAEMAAFQQVADLPLLVNDPQMFLQTRPEHTAHAALMGAGFKTVLGAAGEALSLPAKRAAAREALIQQAGQAIQPMMRDYQPLPIPEKPGMVIEQIGSRRTRPMPAKSVPVVGSRYTVPDVGEVTVSAVTPKTVRVKTAEGKTRVYTRDKWQGQAVVEPAPVTEPIKPAVDAKESLKRLLETEQVPITSMQPGDIFVDIGGGYAYRIDKVNKKTVRAARISRDGSIGKSELIPVDRWTSGIGTGISRKVPRTGYKVTPEQLDVLFGKEPTTKVSVPEVKPVVEPAKPTETPKVETGDIGPYEPSIPSQRQPGQLLSVRANKPLSEMTISELRQLHEHLKQKDNAFIENELRHARDPNVPSQRSNANWYEIREDIALVEKAMRDKHTPAHATKPAPETVPVKQPEAKPVETPKASAPETAKPATPTKASAKVTRNVTGKAEKPRSNTGLTKTQEEYLAKELESILPKLQEEPKPTTIKVPGDGQFTVSNPEQANYLHTFVSGKPLPGMPKIKVKRTFQPTPKKSKPTHQEMVIKAADEAMQLYGHPWAAAEELRQHLDVIKANPSVHPENIEAIISDAISELEIRGHGKTYYAKNKSGSDYEYGDYIPSSIAPGLLKSKRWTDKAPVGTIAETRGAAVVRKKALESRRKALESELRSVESEISKESTVYVWPARRKGVKGRYVTKPLADDHPLKQKRNEIVQSIIEVDAEIKGEIAKDATPTPKASAPETTTPVESRLASESGRVLTRGTPKSQLMIEAEEAATLYTRTRTAEIARANQRARRWQEQLSERELEDIGAAVENIGNIKVKGDTAEAVKKRLSPKQRRVMAEYKAAQERSRQAINEYLKEIGDEEYIKAIEDYLPHFYINKPQQLKAFAQRWLKNSPNAKMRKFPTLKEAVEAGLTPVTQNVAILHKMWNELNWRVATNRRFVREIMGLKTELGENAVVPASKAPAGWEIIDHPAIQRVYGRKTADGKLILHYGGVAVHPDIAPAVKMVLESPFSGKFARGIEMINAISKKSELSLSFFHAWALTESARATLGVRKGLLLLGDKHPITGKRLFFKQPHKVGMEIMRDPELLADPIMHGLQISTGVSDVPIGRIQKGLMAIEAKTRRIPVLRTFTNRLRRFNDFVDRKLWDDYHSGLKIYTYYDQVVWMAKRYPDVPIEKIKTDVANYLNDAYGGQEWATKFGVSIGSHHGKMALTPKVLQFIHGGMLAPDWTLSNFNIAAKTLSKNPVRRAMQIRYWRNMAVTLVLDTIALQQGIYHAFGDPKKGDKQWPWENEVGHRWDIDVTPFVRAMAKALGKPEPEGRYYTHFGKQAREVLGWVVNWPKTLRMKSSFLVQVVYEQLTGSQGDGFDLPFAGVDFIPSIPERTKAIGIKFIPFSLRGNNFAFTAPMTKGMTNWKANVAITKALESYAEDSMWPTIRKQPDFTKKLDALVADILDAAERNGLDSKKIMTQALAETRGKYYGKFFKALEKGDKKEMERAALAVVRLHGGIENMLRSAEARGIELTDEQKALMQKLIKEKQKGREAPPKPGRSINPSSIDNYIRGQMQNAGP